MTAGEFAQVLTAVGVIATAFSSWYNGRMNRRISNKLDVQASKISEVHRTTNGLSARNEAIAEKLGIEKGRAEQLAESNAEKDK